MVEIKLYRPSNGTEGEIFMGHWCARCERDRAHREDPGNADGCDIVAFTMAYDATDPEYPKEWREDGPLGPRCTAFTMDATLPEPLDPSAVVRDMFA